MLLATTETAFPGYVIVTGGSSAVPGEQGGAAGMKQLQQLTEYIVELDT